MNPLAQFQKLVRRCNEDAAVWRCPLPEENLAELDWIAAAQETRRTRCHA